MPNISLRTALTDQDRQSAKNIILNQLTERHLVQALNDLLFLAVSVSEIYNLIHPIVVVNSIKNFIGDDRENPSIVLLEFAVEYVLDFEFRKNDQEQLNHSVGDDVGLTAFIGNLEDACQNGDWEKANALAAHTFIASDNSRGVLDALVELALQDTDRNVLFTFHLLRAFQFQGIKGDNWTYTKCILDYLASSTCPEPHDFCGQTPADVKDQMIKFGDLSLFSTVERLWCGDYVRIRGYQRELSYWVSQATVVEKEMIKPNPSHWLTGHDSKKFISCAERIVMNEKTQKEKATELVILESIRALSKTSSKIQLSILGTRMDLLLNYENR